MPARPLALALALAGAAPAAGQIAAAPGEPPREAPRLVDATDPARIADLVRAAGYLAALDPDDPQGPVIDSAAEGANFSLYFVACENGADCWGIRFASGFALAAPPDLGVVNAWNLGRTIGQASLRADGSVQIAHYVGLRHGVSEANVLFVLDQWRIALRDFMEHIGFR